MTVKASASVLLIAAGLVAVGSAGVLAQTAPATSQMVATAPGKAVGVTQTEATATVEAIDSATRVVTLKRPDGKVFTVTVPPEGRNFDKIKVGDTVRATYTMALGLELKKGAVQTGPATTEESMTRAPVGAQPSGSITRKVTAMADVIAVDTAKHVVTLRGPAGNEVDIDVEDPAQLKNIKKGDHVQVTYAEALAISVEPTGAKAAK